MVQDSWNLTEPQAVDAKVLVTVDVDVGAQPWHVQDPFESTLRNPPVRDSVAIRSKNDSDDLKLESKAANMHELAKQVLTHLLPQRLYLLLFKPKYRSSHPEYYLLSL